MDDGIVLNGLVQGMLSHVDGELGYEYWKINDGGGEVEGIRGK